MAGWDDRGKAEGSQATPAIISRKEAKANGFSKYFTGKPCKYGHIAERYLGNGDCVVCALNRFKNLSEEKKAHKWEVEKKRRKNKIEQHRKSRNVYFKNRYRTDKEYRAYISLRNFVRRLKRSGLKNSNLASAKDLEYTPKEFMEHIESMWQEGMSWDNHGEWHIDHIVPVKHFIDQGIFDPNIVNDLRNLKPIWAEENLMKGSKYNVMG